MNISTQLADALSRLLPMAEARAATLAQTGPGARLGENGASINYAAELLQAAREALAAYDARKPEPPSLADALRRYIACDAARDAPGDTPARQAREALAAYDAQRAQSSKQDRDA